MKSNGHVKTGRKQDVLIKDLPMFTHEEIHEALLWAEDIMERAIVKFMVLDEVAKSLYDYELPRFAAPEIDFGVREVDLTDYARSTLRMLIPGADWNRTNISFEHKETGVPVILWRIRNDLEVFKNPDTRFYTTTEFLLPNPFKIYWQTRHMIK